MHGATSVAGVTRNDQAQQQREDGVAFAISFTNMSSLSISTAG
jgi:hypothetical protein